MAAILNANAKIINSQLIVNEEGGAVCLTLYGRSGSAESRARPDSQREQLTTTCPPGDDS